MRVIDISMPIYRQMAVYKDTEEKRPVIETVRDFEHGTGARESKLTLELHTGTHMDAPLHMIEGGQDTAFFQVEDMVVDCKVIDLTHVTDGISEKDLEGRGISKGDFLLFKTRNSFEEGFNPSFIYLMEGGARFLAEIGIKGVGTDALGIERSQPGHTTHKVLLGSGVYILEGLRLKDVAAGSYTLIAAPIHIMNVEAAPVRALLLDNRL